MKKVFVGIDIGTTSLKAAAFDDNGKRLSLKNIDYTLDTDSQTGYVEFDAEKYVEMSKEAISSIIADVGKITALSIDTQGETLILTNDIGSPLCKAVVWLDNRAVDEAEEIKRDFGNKKVYEVTGQPEITAGWPASKLLWFKKNRPEIWSKTKKIFMLEDYILYRLSGEFVTEPTIQSSTIYYDVVKGEWWKEMLDYLGVTPDMLPTVKKSAEKIGLYNGISVVTGGLDQIAGAIGVGAVDSSCVSEMTGTIMAICAVCDKMPPYRENCIIPCHLHAIDGKYCQLLWSPTAGMALKWFKNEFSEGFSFKELDDLAREVSAGCDGMTMLPYFCGSTMPEYNPDARASFTGITLSHTRGHFVRAILEAVAFTLKQNLNYIGADSDCEIHITGGGASSKLWAQIKADVTERKLYTLKENESACLGTAIMAAVGVGCFESIAEASRKLVSLDKEYLPENVDYTDAYNRFIDINKKLYK